MTELTLTPQQQAIATFKANLHLPNGGFHKLIVELAREYLLPFQEVRKVLKQSQKVIEKKINHQFDEISDYDLTQENWLNLIHISLKEQAKNNPPVMEKLQQSQLYQDAIQTLSQPINDQAHRETAREQLAMTYEIEVYKPLTEMLYTSILYWKLPDDLYQMTPAKQQEFEGYPQHMEAVRHLLVLSEKNNFK
ncbi:hypothetical protein [Vibrio algivorus]|uniref:Uncharacterized protein n=1 Tax=Vibrio algivorus TaxID=1667024 RepID=A0ABQ6EJY2_9VIBR|nr:hypothetical protein [Vibrio algivorus]GLT13432.1 hypothetical protein GCM10007931_04060 [Vibrio algivorus]